MSSISLLILNGKELTELDLALALNLTLTSALNLAITGTRTLARTRANTPESYFYPCP